MGQWISDNAVVLGLILAASLAMFRVGRWVESVNKITKDMPVFMSELRDDIKKILSWLPPALVTRASPLRLTALGEKIAREIDAMEWAKGMSQSLIEDARDREPFEIYEMCKNYVDNDKHVPNREFLRSVNVSAYEAGIDVSGVNEVLAVVLRDQLLSELGSDADEHMGSR